MVVVDLLSDMKYQTRIALLVLKLVIPWWIAQFTTVVIPSREGKLSELIDKN